MQKTDSLYFRVGMSEGSLAKMRVIRRQIIAISGIIDELGNSRETSLAFTHLEQALSYAIKQICLTDPTAKKEEL